MLLDHNNYYGYFDANLFCAPSATTIEYDLDDLNDSDNIEKIFLCGLDIEKG